MTINSVNITKDFFSNFALFRKKLVFTGLLSTSNKITFQKSGAIFLISSITLRAFSNYSDLFLRPIFFNSSVTMIVVSIASNLRELFSRPSINDIKNLLGQRFTILEN